MRNNKEKIEKLLIIDSNSLIHRAFHAIPNLSMSTGERVNAVYGFLQIFLRVIEEFRPDAIAACFDMEGPTFRHKLAASYKATRQKAPDELYAQFARVREILQILGIPIFEKQGYEADDVIGTIVAQASFAKEIIIASGDMDQLQLVTKRVRVDTMKKGIGETVLYDPKAVETRFGGLSPQNIVDYKGLRGDVSDNIPGVKGVGEKTAIQLLRQFGSLEKIYDALEAKNAPTSPVSPSLRQKLLSQKEQAFLSRTLGALNMEVPIKIEIGLFSYEKLHGDQFLNYLQHLEFVRLVERLRENKSLKAKKLAPKQPGLFEQSQEEASSQKERRMHAMREKIEQFFRDGILSKFLYDVELELLPIMFHMEERGIKIDVPYFQELSKEISVEIKEIQQNIYKKAKREFNINSPQQLSQILFQELAISTKGLKKTPGRVISTAAAELEKLRNDHPIIKDLLLYRELQKVFSTYISPLPQMVDGEGRLHTQFDQ